MHHSGVEQLRPQVVCFEGGPVPFTTRTRVGWVTIGVPACSCVHLTYNKLYDSIVIRFLVRWVCHYYMQPPGFNGPSASKALLHQWTLAALNVFRRLITPRRIVNDIMSVCKFITFYKNYKLPLETFLNICWTMMCYVCRHVHNTYINITWYQIKFKI